MRIFQISESVGFGDAIGNHVVALKRVLQNAGYQTEIYTQYIDKRFPPKTAKLIDQLPFLDKNDIIIYQMSIGSPLTSKLKTLHCRKIMMYHNITPPELCAQYDAALSFKAQWGLEQTAEMLHDVEYCIAMSDFSKRDLVSMGYPAERIWVMPSCLIPFTDYEMAPDEKTLKQFLDNWINILFVGRRAPNKKQQDIIQAFAYYKKHINAKSRLFLVGSASVPKYTNALQTYVDTLGIPDIIFPGHISFAQLIALYRSADVFLCMSEHEGFCVPLVEAMYFDVPIIAYSATAVPETLGGCGILLDHKDPILIAAWIDRIVSDPHLQEYILQGQRVRLKHFEPEISENAFLQYLNQII